MDSLGVFCVQRSSSLDPAENRAALDVVAEICAGRPRPDLVVFPEVFARDFGKPGSDLAPYAERLDGPFVTAARRAGRAARGDPRRGHARGERRPGPSVQHPRRRRPEGLRASYRKIHLYDSFGYRESDRLGAGALEPVVVDVKGWRVGLMTCYDLRFPELARQLVDRGAELLLVPAAWVAGDLKVDHWRTLLRARAIENTVYVAAAAQPGSPLLRPLDGRRARRRRAGRGRGRRARTGPSRPLEPSPPGGGARDQSVAGEPPPIVADRDPTGAATWPEKGGAGAPEIACRPAPARTTRVPAAAHRRMVRPGPRGGRRAGRRPHAAGGHA